MCIHTSRGKAEVEHPGSKLVALRLASDNLVSVKAQATGKARENGVQSQHLHSNQEL